MYKLCKMNIDNKKLLEELLFNVLGTIKKLLKELIIFVINLDLI